MKTSEKIDFVVLWVDPSDKEWQKSRAKYARQIKGEQYVDNSIARYRDWANFQYWFRGVEKFAPWVNKVHLVTCGHVPKWLNLDHPKLNIVKHSDFIPKEVLPTFNVNAIELCINKIPGLSEQFVLFNDDVFITRPINPTDFFKNGKPVNTMSLFAIMPCENGHSFYKTVAKDVEIVNRHFDFNKERRNNFGKFISPKQKEWIIFSLPLLFYNRFVGFRNFHICNSYLKSTLNNVWEKESDLLRETIERKFRDNAKDVNDWLFNYWQFASGNFYQRNAHFGTSIAINHPKAPYYIRHKKYSVLCLNDVEDIESPATVQNAIMESFDKILPNKSKFEL